mgnify:FL=1
MSIFVDICKDFGDFRLDVQFSGGNEIIALLGASGCGKSMTLKSIAGIEKPDGGKIMVDGVDLFDSGARIHLTPQQRRTGLLFQSYALFPNMTVQQNIQAGARREKNSAQRARLTESVIESFGLRRLVNRYPSQLSGGQQQRVALARILVSGPRILLLDEPFSALDSHLRFQLEREVGEVLRGFGKTVILVSHDQEEVYRLADKIAVMNAGRIERFGLKDEVFSDPRTKSAARLTGYKNLSRGERLGETRFYAADWGVELTVRRGSSGGTYAAIRARDLRPAGDGDGIECRVERAVENPFTYTLVLKASETAGTKALLWEVDKTWWEANRSERVRVELPPERVAIVGD